MSKSESYASVPIRDIEIFNEIRTYIRNKLNNVDDSFIGDDFNDQRNEILKLLRRSIEHKESNSTIICGSPGCGKTALLNNVLKQLVEENIINEESAVTVTLNGLIHTDDRIALQDIRRQLRITEPDSKKSFSSFQENLIYFLKKLKDKNEEGAPSPCTIFILDQFHLFCEHKNQILLYNLFDISQSNKAPVCIIGLTYYTDVMDLMEKRVLSRFSHRIIWMTESVKYQGRLKLFKDIFTLQANDLPNIDDIYKFIWNTRTSELTSKKEVQEVLKKQLEIDSSQGKFRNLLHKLLSTITFELPLLSVQSIKSVFTVRDSYVSILMRLSLLEMALVIAVKHQIVNFERKLFNFEMIYNQFLKFSSGNATNLVTERSVVLKAFQRLHELEVIVPSRKTIGNATGKVPLEYQLYNLNLTEDQITEGVKLNKDLTTELCQWATFSM